MLASKISGRDLDPITFEILSHRLNQITVEMGVTLERVGGTANTTQMKDYMAALYLPNGDVLSAGTTMAYHAACAGFAVKCIIDRFENYGRIEPDDVFVLNDPYLAAIHQSDVYVISPIHHRDRLVAWSATFVHVMDIGAMSPGGNSPAATEIFHEGVRIPGVKLVDRGTLRRDVFDMIINMTRQPLMVGLDLKCELAANHVAKERVGEFVERYSAELLAEAASEMMRHSESVLRRRIADIPDGEWQETAVIQGKSKWKIQLKLRKQRDLLCFDFTGTDPQANTGINLPYHATYGICFWAVLSTLGYDIPKNHGGLRPIEVTAPEGTIVNVTYPGPVSLNTTSGMSSVKYLTRSALNRMIATSERWKREIIANNLGARRVRHAGINQHGQYYVSTLLELDGHGATSTRDGINSGGGLTCHNVEWVELNFPLLYLFRRHIKDAAGAGRFRGGTGAEALIKIHDAPKEFIRGVAFGVAGLRNSGQGICGGYPGAPSVLILQKQTNIEDWIKSGKMVETLSQVEGEGELLPYCDFELRQKDVLYMRMASGGGYGDPLERSPSLVLRDVEDHLISLEAAREIYGVVFEKKVGAVDNVRTQQRRAELRELRHPRR